MMTACAPCFRIWTLNKAWKTLIVFDDDLGGTRMVMDMSIYIYALHMQPVLVLPTITDMTQALSTARCMQIRTPQFVL